MNDNDGGIQYHQQLGQQENDPEYIAWQQARERERVKELKLKPLTKEKQNGTTYK